MYGGPVASGFFSGAIGASSDAEIMNENPELGSTWKGRMLMHIEAEESKQPSKKHQAIDPSIKEIATNKKMFEPKTYDIILEVGMGICLP